MRFLWHKIAPCHFRSTTFLQYKSVLKHAGIVAPHALSGYSAVVVEDLNVKGVARTKLAKSVHDAGWAMLRFQLTYKARWQRKDLVAIGRFFPSSRLCSACGCINNDLRLSDREWTCGCGAVHDRDLSAACHIRDEGLRLLHPALALACVHRSLA